MQILRPLISLRLGEDHLKPALLTEHLALMQRWRGASDEVWFATDYGMPSLAVHQDHASRMAEAAARVRAAWISASLQISNTIGHGDYLKSLDFSGLTWQPMVGHDGTLAPYCCCPRDPEFHAYIDGFTRAYCAWQPDRLWIDDDLRMNHHLPAPYGCFCDRCLAAFATAAGHDWTRAALVRAINEENDLVTRAAWLQFCRASAADVARTVGRAAIAVAPDCQLGFQHCDTCWGGYNGPDWDHVYRALGAVSHHPVGSRPGGGFYTDYQPREMIQKALITGLQNARISDCVELVSYECENIPSALIGKSARGTALECTLALAQGCNSLSITHLMFPHETEWHETMTRQLAAWRPCWERYIAANAHTRNGGVEVVLSRRQALRRMNPDEAPFAWASTGFSGITPAAVLGLPLCWDEQAPACWLTAPAAYGVDEADLRRLRTRGVILDGEALEILEQRGLAHLLGLRFKPITAAYGNLELSEDALNGRYAGQTLLCGSFMFGTPYSCEVTAGEARVLSRYAHVDSTAGDAEAVAVEQADGTRLVVFGWGIGNPTLTTSRRQQILAAADWVSRGQLPVHLETPGQVVVMPRVDAQGRTVTVLLLNASLDLTPALTLEIRNPVDNGGWTWMRPLEADLAVPSGKTVTLPSLSPWDVGILIRDAGTI